MSELRIIIITWDIFNRVGALFKKHDIFENLQNIDY